MKLSYSWIQEYADFKVSATQLSDDLVRLGHEVESVDLPREAVKGVRVGQILSMIPHPNADKLKLLSIDINEAEPLAIVCGANNMGEGDKIPVATVGTLLPHGLKIKKGKIRGEVSFGMCCSEEELGLAEEALGLLILPPDAPVGAEVGEYLQLEEAVFDLSITPNRGDCMSARGLARDLAADAGLSWLEPELKSLDEDANMAVGSIACEAEDDCPLYMARRIEGLQVDEAPSWMKQRLLAAGQRSVNGVVDVLNYIMLDMGQPMHAFDADTFKGDVCVRGAKEGEDFAALDGRVLKLHAGDLVIADAGKVAALAGIMGSEATAVSEETTNILLESAYFRPASISTTRRQYGMVSEASMRFERAVDPAMVAVAMQRATTLLLACFGGSASVVKVLGDVDVWLKPREFTCDIARLESRLGVAIPAPLDDVLRRMGFDLARNEGQLHVSVPTHRPDVSMAEDMSEEYARVIGFDAIPAELPELPTIQPMQKDTSVQDAVRQGFVQIISYAFISRQEQRLFSSQDEQDIVLENPISDAMCVMRRSLFPGLLNTAKYNLNRQQAGVSLVEQGRIYSKRERCYHEDNILAWLMTGELLTPHWYAPSRDADFYDMKGAVETWLSARGLVARFITDDDVMGLQAGQTAKVLVGKTVLGHVGKVDGDLAASFDLDKAVFVASLNLDILPKAKTAKFVALAEFPAVERDLVFLFDHKTHADDVLQAVRKPAGSLLMGVYIFDRYDGQGVPEDQVSLGLRMSLQHPKRTLTQEDSDQVMQAVIETMQARFGAVLRG
ncbi:MAG: phenylalanine--tRNA ligase subunit beta [Mariprofundaceae bacterium]|nr:phenylalanine--tRNA ligase subunit beta [Mariprofundaceae bacterium]